MNWVESPVNSPSGWVWSLWIRSMSQLNADGGSGPSSGSLPVALRFTGAPSIENVFAFGSRTWAAGAVLPAVITVVAVAAPPLPSLSLRRAV